MNDNSLKVYEIFKSSWGEEKAMIVKDYLEHKTSSKTDQERTTKMSSLAIKEDFQDLKNLISEKYANTIKWLFIFWLGSIATVIGIIKFL